MLLDNLSIFSVLLSEADPNFDPLRSTVFVAAIALSHVAVALGKQIPHYSHTTFTALASITTQKYECGEQELWPPYTTATAV